MGNQQPERLEYMNNIILYIEQNIYSNDPYYIDEEFIDIDFLDNVKHDTYFISNY